MHECDLFTAKEGIRYAAKTRARCDCAPQANAGTLRAGSEQFTKPGKALRTACDSIGALHRSAFQQELDGARCRPCAERARKHGEGARCSAYRLAWLRR